MVWKNKPIPKTILLDILDNKKTSDHLEWDRKRNKGCVSWLINGGWSNFLEECWERAQSKQLEIDSIDELETLIREAINSENFKVIPIPKMFINLDSYGDCLFQVGDGVELRGEGNEAITGQIKAVRKNVLFSRFPFSYFVCKQNKDVGNRRIRLSY